MAQLNGIVQTDDEVGAIYYNGKRYTKTEDAAKRGDIVRCDNDSFLEDITEGSYYLVDIEVDGVVGFFDEAGESEGLGKSGLDYEVNPRYFSVFRCVSTGMVIEQKRAQLAALTAEIAELERAEAEELAAKRPKVGDYAITLEYGYDIAKGSIVTVRQAEPLDYDGRLTFEVSDVLTGDIEWVGQCERLTPEEARAALHAQIDALFPEVIA